jgi:hypothetical protein
VAVRRAEAQEQVARFGLPRDIDPHQALKEELHRCAGWVAWLEARVRQEGEDALTTTAFGEDRSFTVTSPYYEILLIERKLLGDVAQACIKAGVEEAAVRTLEESAQFAANAIRGVLKALGRSEDEPVVRAAIEGALKALPADGMLR